MRTKKSYTPDLEAECRAAFAYYCARWAAAPFHVDKKKFFDLAYEQVDIYLDLRDLDAL